MNSPTVVAAKVMPPAACVVTGVPDAACLIDKVSLLTIDIVLDVSEHVVAVSEIAQEIEPSAPFFLTVKVYVCVPAPLSGAPSVLI